MRDKILAYDVSFADETIVQVLKEVGRKAQKKSYMWVFSGGQPDQFSIVYRYLSWSSRCGGNGFL